MPLIKRSSKKALQENIKTEMDANPDKKKQAQNLAIAYNVQRKARAKHMAAGGMVEDDEESTEMKPMSVVEAIRQRQKDVQDSQADLNRNADEDLNYEDQLSYAAGRQQSYSEEEGLDMLDQPEDSNLHADELMDEDSHDMVSKIRAKVRAKKA